MFDSQSKTLILSFTLAIAVHALILFDGGLVSQETMTGTDGGGNSIEVELTEGLPKSETAPIPAPAPPVQPVLEPISEPHQDVVPSDEMITPETNVVAAPPSEATKPNTATTNLHTSSGSADQPAGKVASGGSAPGTSATHGTGGSGGAAWADPHYANNPAPIYPLEARQMRQQGTVVLSVLVNAQGVVETLAVKESSTHILLDQAAMQAVKRWHFKPATVAGIPVSSQVEVPIEFHLEQ